MSPQDKRAHPNTQKHKQNAASDREMLTDLFEEALKTINRLKKKGGPELHQDLRYVSVIVDGLKSDVGELKKAFEIQEKKLEDAERKCKEQAEKVWELEEDLKWEKRRTEDVQDELHRALKALSELGAGGDEEDLETSI